MLSKREKDRLYAKQYYEKNKEHRQQYQRAYRQRPGALEQRRAYKNRIRYGLMPDQYEKILKQQRNRCAVCGATNMKRKHVDHCHTSNKVRGILCHYCNVALGMVKDSPKRLAELIIYLEKHR